MTRFEDYHLGPANIDEVEFLLSAGSSMLMYENDEIHITGIGLTLALNAPVARRSWTGALSFSWAQIQ